MSAQPRILVVEDDILIGTHIADTLSVSGYASHLVTSLPEALSALSAQSFDAATLDLRIGGEECVDLARALQRGGIPFLFCTGSLTAEVREAFAGEVTVVEKPFRDEDLLAAVAAL